MILLNGLERIEIKRQDKKQSRDIRKTDSYSVFQHIPALFFYPLGAYLYLFLGFMRVLVSLLETTAHLLHVVWGRHGV